MITDEMRDYKVNIKYKVDNFDILFENGDIEEFTSEMIRHLYIERDYESLFFPLINISIVMDDVVYQRIQQESETVQFRVRIVRNVYDSKGKLLKYEMFCNKTFRCFMEKNNIVKDIELVNNKRDVDKSTHPGHIANPREFYIFLDDVIKCKKMLNLSIEDASLTDLVLYMFNQCGVEKVLMSKLDNQSRVSNLILPNGNIIETILFLEDNLGFYRKGTLLYFDIDNAYLIDKNSKCTSWRKNEVRVTHIHVANHSGSDSQLNGQFTNKDRKQTHVFTHTERVEIRNSNIINDQLSGNNITMIDAKNNSVSNISSNSTQIGNANTNIMNIKSDNKFANEILQTRMKERECICTMSFLGVDIDVFSPNKEIIVTYEEPELHKKFSGNYRILKVISTLKKDSHELVGEVQVTMTKQE